MRKKLVSNKRINKTTAPYKKNRTRGNKTKNKTFNLEAFNTESQIIDDIKKNEMRSHIKTIRNALDENIYNELIKKSSEILH